MNLNWIVYLGIPWTHQLVQLKFEKSLFGWSLKCYNDLQWDYYPYLSNKEEEEPHFEAILAYL